MKASTVLALGLVATLASACGSSSPNTPGTAGADNAGAGNPGTAGAGTAGAGTAGEGTAGAGIAGEGTAGAGIAGAGGAASQKPSAMPLLNRGVPAFSSDSASSPSSSNDDSPMSSWGPNQLPAWVAYDVSGADEAARHQVLAAWYAPHAGAYLLTAASAKDDQAPLDYTIEINPAP
ncbi:MAG: hypothetical protein ABW061_06870, partial [Polyangiaceae bacterium]